METCQVGVYRVERKTDLCDSWFDSSYDVLFHSSVYRQEKYFGIKSS